MFNTTYIFFVQLFNLGAVNSNGGPLVPLYPTNKNEIVHEKMNIWWKCTHLWVIQDLDEFLQYVEM